MDSVLKRLRNPSDPARAEKVADALRTLVEHRALEVEDAHCHSGALTVHDVLSNVPEDVLQFFQPEFFDLIGDTPGALFALLQGPYAPWPGSKFELTLQALGWQRAAEQGTGA